MTEGYDVIGDVHGHAKKLENLLRRMEYSDTSGVWRHADRTAIFVGDLIDRGPQQIATVAIARRMIEAGSAQAVMGNHEFNAIAWRHGLRQKTPERIKQHEKFLNQVGEGSPAHHEMIEWFETLPMWLELDGLRVVHACWHDQSQTALGGLSMLTPEAIRSGATKGTAEYEAIEILLKGPEIPVPPLYFYKDKNEQIREDARYRWWSAGPTTFRNRAELPSDSRTASDQPHPGFPDTEIPPPLPVDVYNGPPVIYGHYWQTGTPALTSTNTACVDYSAGKDGPLVAYQWSGESTLSNENFISSR
jgi:hypothetical protein